MATTTNAARYRYLTGDEQALLEGPALTAYRAQRAEFEREVRWHYAHLMFYGWLDVGTKGRVVRFEVPVQLSHPMAYRGGTMGMGLRGCAP